VLTGESPTGKASLAKMQAVEPEPEAAAPVAALGTSHGGGGGEPSNGMGRIRSGSMSSGTSEGTEGLNDDRDIDMEEAVAPPEPKLAEQTPPPPQPQEEVVKAAESGGACNGADEAAKPPPAVGAPPATTPAPAPAPATTPPSPTSSAAKICIRAENVPAAPPLGVTVPPVPSFEEAVARETNPAPLRAPTTILPCMQGVLRAEGARHVCKGEWGMSLADTEKGITSPFEFSRVADEGDALPTSGAYSGHFMLQQVRGPLGRVVGRPCPALRIARLEL
jgi:hypothetical protein